MGRNASLLALCVAIVLLVGCVAGSTAWALPPASVMYQDSFGLQTPVQTNWGNGVGVDPNVVLQLKQFDPSIGMLQSIHIDLHASANGTLKFESRASLPETIIASATDTVSIQRPDGSNFVTNLAIARLSSPVSKYDGVTDFAGTSGVNYSNSAADDDIINLGPGMPGFASFIGTGTIPLMASAVGTTSLSGSTSLASSVRSFAEADVSVTYTYSMLPATLPIPEPAGVGMILLAGVLAVRPKRKL